MIENLNYLEAIRMAFETCMGAKNNEEVLVVGDTDNLVIANSFASVAATLGTEVTLIVMKPRKTILKSLTQKLKSVNPKRNQANST